MVLGVQGCEAAFRAPAPMGNNGEGSGTVAVMVLVVVGETESMRVTCQAASPNQGSPGPLGSPVSEKKPESD